MINLFTVHMPESVDNEVLDVLHSGHITQGDMVDNFEYDLAKFIGNENVVTVNSCTSALTLAMRLIGIGPGDEVITTPMTCTATNLPILSFGADIKFADVEETSGNISPKSIKSLISDKTKAIIFTDWGGTPAKISEIISIARAHNIKVIEDAAHAFGAEYNGKKLGNHCDFTCFSFQAIKHITTGDGGLLVCKRESDANRAKKLRWFGIDRSDKTLGSRIEQDIDEYGYKFHMNDIAATIGIEQLSYIDGILEDHRVHAHYYRHNLSKYYVQTPLSSTKGTKSSWWIYTVLLPSEKDRDELINWCNIQGIQISQVHKRNDKYKVFKKFANKKSPGLESFSSRMVCIPVHHALSHTEVCKITDALNTFARIKVGS